MSEVGPVNSNLRLFLLARTWRRDVLSTVQRMVKLGCLGIRVVSRISSIILADLAMRGFAISFLTLARVASPRSFFRFLCRMHLIMISRWKPCNPLSHSCEICGRFLLVVLNAMSATAFQNNRLPWRLS